MTSAPSLAVRRAAHATASARLSVMSETELVALVADAKPLELRGRTQPALLHIDGVPAFVKTVPLADIERRPGNEHATRNLFRLPLYYQYGVGSLGFGAWRELAAARMASDSALSGACERFPLLFHWRVLPREPIPLTDAWRERRDRAVTYWNGSAAVARRLEGFRTATASLALFLEYIPESLGPHLTRRFGEDRAAAETALLSAHDQLDEVARFLGSQGMAHFDLHYHNVLTEGGQVYVTDFGLALWSGFELSPGERRFFDRHRLYDRCYLAYFLVAWLRQQADPEPKTPALAARIERYQPLASVMEGFFTSLREKTKTTPYPTARLERAFAQIVDGDAG